MAAPCPSVPGATATPGTDAPSPHGHPAQRRILPNIQPKHPLSQSKAIVSPAIDKSRARPPPRRDPLQRGGRGAHPHSTDAVWPCGVPWPKSGRSPERLPAVPPPPRSRSPRFTTCMAAVATAVRAPNGCRAPIPAPANRADPAAPPYAPPPPAEAAGDILDPGTDSFFPPPKPLRSCFSSSAEPQPLIYPRVSLVPSREAATTEGREGCVPASKMAAVPSSPFRAIRGRARARRTAAAKGYNTSFRDTHNQNTVVIALNSI